MGKVDEVDVGEGGLCVGKYARVRITRPIDEPLMRCVPLKQEGLEKEVIVIFQYERLSEFCFLCGKVGHISRDCDDTSVDRQSPRYDGWLRAGRSFIGRRNPVIGGGSPVRESPVRKLGFRENIEFTGGSGLEKDKLVGMGDGGQKASGNGEVGSRRVEGDGSSSEGNRDICMEEDMDVLRLGGKENELERSVTSLGVSSRSRGDDEGNMRAGVEKAREKAKSKSPLKSQQMNSRNGGKG